MGKFGKFGILGRGMAVNTFKTALIKKEKASNDAWKFFFERPPKFEYGAGQYIKMWMDLRKPDNRGKTRYFTLSSSPMEEHLLVTTRILKSTFKLKLGSLNIGTIVKMRGPWGDFVLRQAQDKKETRPLVFIAGGIGMTPFRSMLKFAEETNFNTPMTLLVSYKTPDQILFKEELSEIAKKNPSIKIITTITEPDNRNWKGETGRIDEQMLKRHIAKLQDNLYYIAGPDPLVEAIEKLLLGMKIKKDQILTDGFPGY